MRPTRRLRELLSQPGVIRSLGAHDVFTARLIEAAGLETVFLGGFGAAAWSNSNCKCSGWPPGTTRQFRRP